MTEVERLPILGHHRSRALAEERARREDLEIISRRRGDGRFSSRGHLFVFRKKEEIHIILRKQTPAKKERNGWQRASVEVSITASENLSNMQIKEIADAIAHQQPLPFGATAEAIEWQVGKRAKTYPYLKDAQSGFARFGLLSWKLKTT